MNELKNIVEKYDLTKQQISDGIDQLCKGGLGSMCDTTCMLAFAEVLTMLEYVASKGE
jgi:hypothetical protein